MARAHHSRGLFNGLSAEAPYHGIMDKSDSTTLQKALAINLRKSDTVRSGLGRTVRPSGERR